MKHPRRRPTRSNLAWILAALGFYIFVAAVTLGGAYVGP